MRNILGISTIAIAAAVLAAVPASALSINLGGAGNGGLLNLGGGGNGNGGSGNAATVQTNLLGNGNDGVLGTNLLGGSSNADTTAIVDLGGTGNSDPTATVKLRGAGDGQLLDLFGNGNAEPTTASVKLGGTGATDGDVLLDLFGSGAGNGGNDAAVTLGSGGAIPTSTAMIDLFGPGNGIGGDAGAGGGNVGMPGDNGSAGQPGTGITTSGAVQIASIDGSAGNCFTPDATQQAKLINRHTYGASTFAAWGEVSSVKVVDVGLCGEAGASIAGNGNIVRLQSMIAAQPALRSSLGKLGHTPNDVIGADKSGSTLVVYVM